MARVLTIHGEMDDSELQKVETVTDNDHEFTVVTEYWWHGECVHRSVHVTIKEGLRMFGDSSKLG